MFSRDALFIGGRWTAPADTATIDVISPTTEELVGRVPAGTAADIDRAVSAARRAFDEGPWPSMPLAERGARLTAMEARLRCRLAELVDVQIDEMGAPRRWIAAGTERMVAATTTKVAAAHDLDLRDLRDGSAGKVLVMREPAGVVGAIIPWNAPIPMLLAKLVPALLMGCTLVVKPPPESPLSAFLLAEALAEVDLPEGVVSIVAGGRQTGEHLVRHPDVDKIAFTGSTAAGARVAAMCGEQIKSATLELGGKSAAIILDDADLDRRLPLVVASGLPNSGQVCFATTRVLAPRARYAEVVDGIADLVSAMRVGDPHDVATDVGPLVAARQRERVEGYIRAGREQGARLVLGGGRPAGLERGWFVEPTVFADVDNAHRISQEEIFGPVLSIIPYADVPDAVRIANDSEYGLGGAVFTEDPERGIAVAAQVRTGTCSVNEGPPAGGGGPFGGYKRSGLGREYAREGWDAYLEIKSVSLPPGYVPADDRETAAAAS